MTLAMPRSIEEAGRTLREGAASCESLTRAFLERIERLNFSVNAFITVCGERALECAAALDRELRAGNDRGPLHGIPIVHKDIFDTAGIVTTYGSALHRTRIPVSDAAVTARLEAAGTVLLGKTNMTEFASDASGRNRYYGNVHNPLDVRRSAGGSSSGTAAALAARMCLGGTGSDTGGSIRIPASWCGIVGLRPTAGLVSLAGAFPRAPSLDCAGPMARSVQDVALLLAAMIDTGDGCDATAARVAADCASASHAERLDGLRLATIDDYTFRDIDSEVADAVRQAIAKLAQLGADIRSLAVPQLSGDELDYNALLDVLLYEFHQVLGDVYRRTPDREMQFGPIVRANLERGARVTQAPYERALHARPRLVAEVTRLFADADAFVTPTMPRTAAMLDEPPEVFDEGRRFNLPVSYLGLPSISVPCGTDAAGMPIGLSITAQAFGECTLLRVAAALSRALAETTAPAATPA